MNPAQIIETAAAVWGSNPTAVLGTSRNTRHVRARRLAMALIRHVTGLSYVAIGEIMRRDHGTVIHACRVMSEALSRDGANVEAYQFLTIRKRIGDQLAARAAAMAMPCTAVFSLLLTLILSTSLS